MKRMIFAAAAAACLLAGPPALAAHVSKTVTVHQNNWNNGNGHVSRTVRTTHVNVIRGGQDRVRNVRQVTTRRTVNGHVFTNRNTVVNGRVFGNNRGLPRAAINFRVYRRNFNAPRRFRFGVYNRPNGWYAHRWVYGERLPGGWYGRNYWIPNYVNFGLVGPPDGYQWVRSGDDALLVDVDTGEVLQVEYGVFY